MLEHLISEVETRGNKYRKSKGYNGDLFPKFVFKSNL